MNLYDCISTILNAGLLFLLADYFITDGVIRGTASIEAVAEAVYTHHRIYDFVCRRQHRLR